MKKLIFYTLLTLMTATLAACNEPDFLSEQEKLESDPSGAEDVKGGPE